MFEHISILEMFHIAVDKYTTALTLTDFVILKSNISSNKLITYQRPITLEWSMLHDCGNNRRTTSRNRLHFRMCSRIEIIDTIRLQCRTLLLDIQLFNIIVVLVTIVFIVNTVIVLLEFIIVIIGKCKYDRRRLRNSDRFLNKSMLYRMRKTNLFYRFVNERDITRR